MPLLTCLHFPFIAGFVSVLLFFALFGLAFCCLGGIPFAIVQVVIGIVELTSCVLFLPFYIGQVWLVIVYARVNNTNTYTTTTGKRPVETNETSLCSVFEISIF